MSYLQSENKIKREREMNFLCNEENAVPIFLSPNFRFCLTMLSKIHMEVIEYLDRMPFLNVSVTC